MPERSRSGLQPLLERRRYIEEERRQNYAARQGELDDNAQALERLTEMLRIELLQAASAAYLGCVDAAIAARRCRSAQLEGALEQARTTLVAASRERRVIEKLLERRRRAYETHRARREEQEIEDANR